MVQTPAFVDHCAVVLTDAPLSLQWVQEALPAAQAMAYSSHQR
jgi:hypothetical protein